MAQYNPDNPLTKLIKARAGALDLDQKKLRLRMKDEHEIDLHKSTVSVWFRGGGVADQHRPALAEVLGISLHDLQTAASAKAKQDALARADSRVAA